MSTRAMSHTYLLLLGELDLDLDRVPPSERTCLKPVQDDTVEHHDEEDEDDHPSNEAPVAVGVEPVASAEADPGLTAEPLREQDRVPANDDGEAEAGEDIAGHRREDE